MIWEYRYHHWASLIIFGGGFVVGYGVIAINWGIIFTEFGTIFMNKRFMLIKEEWNTWYGMFIQISFFLLYTATRMIFLPILLYKFYYILYEIATRLDAF